MKKKWVSSLLLGSLFLQVVTPMVSFAQETIETTATSATIKKEDNPTKNSTNTSTSKDIMEQSTAQPEANNSIDTNNPLNLSPVSSGKPSDLENKNLNNQEATKPTIQASAPVADDNLGPELFQNSNFDQGPVAGGSQSLTSIPGWTSLYGETFVYNSSFSSITPFDKAYVYQEVPVTPGKTVRFGIRYLKSDSGKHYAKMLVGPVSNDINDFLIAGEYSGSNSFKWKYQNFVVPQGMTKMRFMFTGYAIFSEVSLKEDLNPPVNSGPPVINASDRQVELNSTFDPLEGVTATDAEDGDIPLTDLNVVHNDVDTSKAGSYSVTYSVLDSGGLEGKKTITVTVGDANTPPAIHVPNTTVSLPQGGSFDPAPSKWNITATDAEDGDLTKNIVVKSNNVDTSKPGQYKVTYSVTDSGNLNTTADMTVVVSPNINTPPVIHIPNVPVSITQGDSFDPAPSKWNITATDVEDGDLTSKIKVKNNTVDTTKPGFYEVTYSVTDSDNIETTGDMPVTVMPTATGVINLTVDRDRFDIEEGQSVDITGEVWSPRDVTLIANLTEKDSSKTLDQDIFIGSLANQHNQYSLSVPKDNLSVGTHTFVVSGVGNGTQVKKEVTVNVKAAVPAHTIDLTVDQDTFDVEKGESVDVTGEIWSNIQTSMQAVSIMKQGESSSFDSKVFMSPSANQHNQYSFTIPADKLDVGKNTFRLTGTDDQGNITKDVTVNVKDSSDLIELKNGSFEKPLIAGQFDYQYFKEGTPDLEWKTTASDGKIELQKMTSYGPPPDGKQWAELNANSVGALYQDVQTKPGSIIHWSVYHRGRSGTDTAKVKFGAPNGKMEEIQTMTTGKNWKEYSGVYKIPDGQTVTRFQFEAVATSTGNSTEGNLLDHVVFTNKQIGEKPVIQAEDKTIVQNSTFDPLADVSATDKEDGTVPVTVRENTVDTSKPGTYKVVYWATDSDQNTTEKTITVTVEPGELSFNVPDTLDYDEQALSGNKEYAKRTDKNWQITIDNSKKVKWQVKAKAGEMVGETSHAKYKDATVYVDDLGNESSLAATVLIAQGDEQKVDPIISWQEDKGVLFAVDPTNMKAENYKGTINWTLEQAP